MGRRTGTAFSVLVKGKAMDVDAFAKFLNITVSNLRTQWSNLRRHMTDENEIMKNIVSARDINIDDVELVNTFLRYDSKRKKTQIRKKSPVRKSPVADLISHLPKAFSYAGETHSRKTWQKLSGVHDNLIMDRIGAGWPVEDAIVHPENIGLDDLESVKGQIPSWMDKALVPVKVKKNGFTADDALETISDMEFFLRLAKNPKAISSYSKELAVFSNKLNSLRHFIYATN